MPTASFTASRIATPSGIIRPGAGTATKACASTICCCRPMLPTGLRPAISTKSREPRSAPRTIPRSGASWRYKRIARPSAAAQKALGRGGERVLPFPERRQRDDQQDSVAGYELAEIACEREIALPRHGKRDGVARRRRPEILADPVFADRKFLPGEGNAAARSGKTRQSDKGGGRQRRRRKRGLEFEMAGDRGGKAGFGDPQHDRHRRVARPRPQRDLEVQGIDIGQGDQTMRGAEIAKIERLVAAGIAGQ